MKAILLLLSLAAVSTSSAGALESSCSQRARACDNACQPELVRSGAQAGGTVEGCHASCSGRLATCLSSGTWVHRGRANYGRREAVERR